MAINLSTIRKGVRLKPPKITVYGVGGIGKTTFAAGAPNPIFVFTEEGQGSLDVARFEPRENDPVVRSWVELIECCEALHREPHDYETVVIDTLDFAEPLLWEYTAKQHGKEDVESWGYGKGYVYALDEARRLFDWLDALRNHRNMAVVLLCHNQTKKFESPDAPTYDRYQLRLQDRLAAHVHYWSDALLFAAYKTNVVTDKEAFGGERRRAVGIGERVLYTEERPQYWAKNRYGLPHQIELSWMAFQNGIVIPQTETATAAAAAT